MPAQFLDPVQIAAAQVLIDVSALAGHPALAGLVDPETGEIDPKALTVTALRSLKWAWSSGERALLDVLAALLDDKKFQLDLAAIDERSRAAVIYALALRWGAPLTGRAR